MKFRKKPIVIEAIHWDGTQDARDKLLEFGGFTLEDYNCYGSLIIPTLEGDMRADIGDWIIKGVNGEFYPCKQNIFEKTYYKVD